MPAARYWRIVGVEAYAGSDLELSELHLYGSEGRLDAAAPLVSSIPPKTGTLGALQDGDVNTFCRFSGAAVRAAGFAISWDFGAGQEVDVIGVRIAAADDSDTFMASCTLQFSHDARTWERLVGFNRYAYPGAREFVNIPTLGDLDFDYVSLLLPMKGVEGSTSFIDRSPMPKTVSVFGNAKISTLQSKFGTSSLLLDGAGSYLALTGSPEFVFRTGDFTVEFFLRTTDSNFTAIDFYKDGSSGWQVFVNSAGRVVWYVSVGTKTSTAIVNDGVWHHVAVVRRSGQLYFFIDGVMDGGAAALSTDLNNQTGYLGIGAQVSSRNATYDLAGNIEEVRITKGKARYTTSFTPPAAPFPVSNVLGTVFVPPLLKAPAPEQFLVAASAAVAEHSANGGSRLLLAQDTEFGGQGCIYGTVELYAQAGNIPLPRRVRLHRSRDGLLVRETWSDAQGNYRFDGITGRYKYDVIAWDHEGLQQSVVANDLTPEVMP
jgi:hypothetical protein